MKVLIVLILLLAVILEIASLPFLNSSGVSPNLVLVILLLLVILKTFEKTWRWIVLIGLFLDFFSGLPFGSISLSLVLITFIIDWLGRNIFSEVKLWTSLSLVAIGTILYHFFLIGWSNFLAFLGQGESISYFCSSLGQCLFSSFGSILIGLGYNLLITLIVFYGVKKILYQK